MLAGELALAGVDVAIVERRASQDLAGSRAGGLHSRTIEVLDQRGIADRFLSQGQVRKAVGFHMVWLGVVAKALYARQMATLLRPDVKWAPALIFYVLTSRQSSCSWSCRQPNASHSRAR